MIKPKKINFGKALTKLASQIVVLIVASLRYNQQRPPKPCIVAIWHEDMAVACKFFSKYETVTLVSPSNDAEIFSLPLMKSNQIKPLRYTASKSDLALQGLYELMKHREHCIVIPVDGSRGPKRKAKGGVFAIAKRKQIPLYACRFSYKGVRLENTWDKMKIPYPFAFIKAKISEPLSFAKQSRLRESIADFERLMAELGDD